MTWHTSVKMHLYTSVRDLKLLRGAQHSALTGGEFLLGTGRFTISGSVELRSTTMVSTASSSWY